MNEPHGQPEQRDAAARAEELVDALGLRVGQLTSRVGHELLRLSARAREEAEDIWAEAQELRQKPTRPTH